MKAGLLKKLDSAWYLLLPFFVLLKALTFYRSPLKEKSLIVRPGGLGDLVLLTLAIQKYGLPFSHFTFLIEKRSEPWAQYLKLDYVIYDRAPLRAFWKIASRYPLVIVSEQYFGLAALPGFAARSRGGKLTGFSTLKSEILLDRVSAYDPLSSHEFDEFTKLLQVSLKTLPMTPTSMERQPQDYQCVAITGLQAESRSFPVRTWVALILKYSLGLPIKIVASPTDQEFAYALKEQLQKFPHQVEVIQGDFTEVVECIRNSKGLLTVDGGPTHIASYFNVPTICIFTSGRDQKWAPLGAGSRVVRRLDLPCQPCTVFGQVPPCPNGFACKDLEKMQTL